MSGLEALSLSCNIIQIIEVTAKIVHLGIDIYDGHSPDDSLRARADHLTQLSEELQDGYQGAAAHSPSEAKLVELAQKCNVAARDVTEEIDFLLRHQQQGSLRATIRVAAKVTWRKRRLKRLEKSLAESRDMMESSLLARVCKRADAIEIQQRAEFHSLRKDLQEFITQYASDNQSITKLISDTALASQRHAEAVSSQSEAAIKNHTTIQLEKTEKTITSRIALVAKEGKNNLDQSFERLRLEAATDQQRERLLKSLEYPGMLERRNTVSDAHEGTFEWIWGHDDTGAQSPEEGYDTATGNRAQRRSDTTWDHFGDWLRSDSKMYWISGKPGSGKSTLMRYLVTSLSTKAYPDFFSGHILSHFFWKPGSELQNNVKGLYLSLLHQLLSRHDPAMIDLALSMNETRFAKVHHTEWSCKELESLCHLLLAMSEKSYCIFVDGLDEICVQDGEATLVQLLNEVANLSNIKMCVASRPEPVLYALLRRNPQLRVQDITAADLARFAADSLQPYWETSSISAHYREYIVRLLVQKASGVFLWLHLVVRRLVRDLLAGLGQKEMLGRIEALPEELMLLYNDMLLRMNKDAPVFLELTAEFFNRLLAALELQRRLGKESPEGVPLVQLMALVEYNRWPALSRFDASSNPKHCEIGQRCLEMKKELEYRCAGLVEVSCHKPEIEASPLDLDKKGPCTDDGTEPQSQIWYYAKFIHRSALDFLTDTEEGRRLRAKDLSSDREAIFRSLTGALVVQRLGSSIEMHDNFPLRFLEVLSADRAHLGAESAAELFTLCLTMEDHEWAPSKGLRVPRRARPQFLALVSQPSLRDLVEAAILQSGRPTSLATEVLRDVMCHARKSWVYNFASWYHKDDIWDNVKFLLALGVDWPKVGRARFLGEQTSDYEKRPLCSTFSELICWDFELMMRRRGPNLNYPDVSDIPEAMLAERRAFCFLSDGSWESCHEFELIYRDYARFTGNVSLDGWVYWRSLFFRQSSQHFIFDVSVEFMMAALRACLASALRNTHPLLAASVAQTAKRNAATLEIRPVLWGLSPDLGSSKTANSSFYRPARGDKCAKILGRIQEDLLEGRAVGTIDPDSEFREAWDDTVADILAGSPDYELVQDPRLELFRMGHNYRQYNETGQRGREEDYQPNNPF